MKNNNLISISGKIGSGKDLTAEIIQYLTSTEYKRIGNKYSYASFIVDRKVGNEDCMSSYQIRRFADKLKDIVCLLIGCTREQLEDREFKEKELGEEWWFWDTTVTGLPKTLHPYTKKDKVWYASAPLIKLTPRLLLQLLGTECGRQIIHPNIWVNALMSEYINNPITILEGQFRGGLCNLCDNPVEVSYFLCDKHIEESKNRFPNWIITDLRFPNEFEAVKERGGICIKVNRPKKLKVAIDMDSMTRAGKEAYNAFIKEHESETALDGHQDWDYIIQNDGTIEDLIQKVKKILIEEGIN